MEEKWVPPSDAVEVESNEGFTPPSDAIEVSPVKKKVGTVSEPLVKPLAKKSETSPSPYAPESLQSKSDGSTSVSDGLSSDSKSLPKIKGEAASKLKEVDNQIRVVSKKWNDLERVYKQQQAEMQNYQDQVNDPMVSDQAKAQLIDQHNSLLENSKNVYAEMEKAKQSAIKLQQSKQTLGKIEKVDSDLKLKKESLGSEMFDALARGSASLGSSIAKTPAFLYDIAALPQNYLAETYPATFGELHTSSEKFAENLDLPENKIAQYYDQAVEDSRAKFAQKYDKPITEYIDNGEYANALKSLSVQVAESTPVTLSLMMGGMAGASNTATTMGGGLVFGADKKSQLDKENPDMKETSKTLNALSTGLMEGVFETYGITKLGSIIKNVVATEGKEAAAQIAKKGFMEVYAPVLKKYAGVAGEEMTGEMATQFTQNAIDKYSGAKPDLNLMDGVIDAGLVGLASSGVYSSPVAVVDLVKTGKQRDVYNQAMELKQDPDKIQTVIQSVKDLVDQGKVTQEAADKFVGKLDNMIKVDDKIPDYVKGEERAKAVDLLLERDDIEQSISGLEPAMVTEKAKRIAEINSDLNLISKNAERVQMERKQFNTEKNAIQEQETASLLQRKQGEIGITGSERVGVEPSNKGQEITPPSKEEKVSKPEGLELLNTEDLRRPNGSIGTQGFDPSQMKDLVSFLNDKLKLNIPLDLLDKSNESLKPLIEHLRNDKESVNKIIEYVKTNPSEITRLPDGTIEFNDGNHRANLLNLIGSDIIPVIDKNNIKEEKVKPIESAKPTPTKEELIKKREKETGITEKQKSINDLVFSVEDYNKLKNGRLGKDKPEGRQMKNDIIGKAREMGYIVEESNGYLKLKTPQGTKVRYVRKNENNKALSDSNAVLEEKAKETVDLFNKINNVGLHAFPPIVGMDGKRMSQSQLETAVSDVVNGLRSNGANELLNQLEGMHKSGTMTLIDPNTREEVNVPLQDFLDSILPENEDEYQMSDEEMEQLAKEYDEYYNSLTQEQQDHENEIGKQIATEQGTEGEENVTDKASPESNPKVEGKEVNKEIISKFAQATEMYNEMSDAEGGSKKRTIAEKRRAFLDKNPSIKYIDDNIKEIHRQLEELGMLTKEGNCP